MTLPRFDITDYEKKRKDEKDDYDESPYVYK